MAEQVVGRIHFVPDPDEFWVESHDGEYFKVTMPDDIRIEDVPLETLLDIEMDGEKVLSWQR